MDWLHVPSLPGTGSGGYEYGLAGGPPNKRLRTTKSHSSLLGSVQRAVRNPFDTLGTIGETLGIVSDQNGWHLTADERERRLQLLRLRGAKDVEEWKAAARKLDRLEGAEEWKHEDDSNEYDVPLVRERLAQLDAAREGRDVKAMLFLMRTSLTRDLGGMGDLRLYQRSRTGTKRLIERYIAAVQETLEVLVECAGRDTDGEGEVHVRHLHAEMLLTRQSFGRTALLLSGGGTLGMNHIGVVKSLFEAKLLPRVISGASAGSIVCSVLCTKTDEEMPQVLQEFCYGELDVFEKEGQSDSYVTKVARFLKDGALFDIKHLTRVMEGLLGNITFKEAYFRSNRILNITVSSASVYDAPRLLNYYTAPNVIIWSAVAASCSVPFIFTPAALKAKDHRTGKVVDWEPSTQKWIDGSVDNDIPTTRLAEMFNVNHFIVSQVNPHVVPFLREEEGETNVLATGPLHLSTTSAPDLINAPPPSWLQTTAAVAKAETLHRLHVLSDLGIFPNAFSKLRSVLGQRYSGDITIFPAVSYTHFPSVLKNPTTEFMVSAMLCGERATWPKLGRVAAACAVELALDRAVKQLKDLVVFSPSQKDLRLSTLAQQRRQRRSSEHDRRRRGSVGSRKTTKSALLQPRRNPNRASTISMPEPQTSPPYSAITQPAVKVVDYFSSGADSTSLTSGYTDNDNDDEAGTYDSDYDSDGSLGSPFSPGEPDGEPGQQGESRKHVQSQPGTPRPLSSPWNESPISYRGGGGRSGGGGGQQNGAAPGRGVSPGLYMTPSRQGSLEEQRQQQPQQQAGNRPSSPELRYKRLFHGNGAEVGKNGKAANVDEAEGPEVHRKGSKFGLSLLTGNGAKGRIKRNFSTGFEGLAPPGKR